MKHIIDDPKLIGYLGQIARGELGEAVQYVNRKRRHREKHIENTIDANASIEYISNRAPRTATRQGEVDGETMSSRNERYQLRSTSR